MALSLDGVSPNSGYVTASSQTISLTTTGAGKIVVLNASSPGTTTITSVTGSGLTFARRSGLTPPDNETGGSWGADEYLANSSTAFSGNLTVNFSANNSNYVIAFGIKEGGAVDTNVGLAITEANDTQLSMSTDNLNDFLFAVYSSNTSTPTTGGSWNTLVDPTGKFAIFLYQIVTSTQSSLTVDCNDGRAGIADAVMWLPPSGGSVNLMAAICL